MNAKEARARVDAERKKRKDEEAKKEAAIKAYNKAQVERLIKDAKSLVDERVEDECDFADLDIEEIWDRPLDVQKVMSAMKDEGFGVATWVREDRDWDEPGRAPDKVHVLRIEW